MTSVKIKFRKSTVKNKEGVLYFQLIHKRATRLITTRFRLYPYEWNDRISAIIINSVDDRSMYLQNIKKSLAYEIQQIYDLIFLLEKRGEYTTKELADLYINNSLNGYFFPFLKGQIQKLKSEKRFKTASIYETVKRSFSRFRNGEDVLIEKIDPLLIRQYEIFLKNNGVILNTISCYMRALRAVYNQAIQKGLAVSKNPFKYVYTGIDKTSKRAVNEDIIMKLNKLNLSGYANLQLARDLFMFSFYTRGMSFIDMSNLKESNLKNGYLIYSRSKTRQVLSIKMEKCIEEIIERYKDITIDGYLLPIYTIQNHSYNSYLRTYNKRLKKLSEILGLEKTLSSYVSRHSWATLALRKGISVQIISEGMGHENEKTTRIYLASLDQSIIDEANARIIAL